MLWQELWVLVISSRKLVLYMIFSYIFIFYLYFDQFSTYVSFIFTASIEWKFINKITKIVTATACCPEGNLYISFQVTFFFQFQLLYGYQFIYHGYLITRNCQSDTLYYEKARYLFCIYLSNVHLTIWLYLNGSYSNKKSFSLT